MIRVLLLVLVLALAVPAHAANDDFTLLDSTGTAVVGVCTTKSGEKVKCVKFNPRSTPVPTAVPTPAPMPCESIGTGYIKTFTVGKERRLCFTSAAGGSPIVEVGTTNRGNASCADFWMQMYSPTGAVSEMSRGVQPGVAMMPRVAGKYYIAIGLTASNSTTCSTLTFTVR